MRYENLVKPGRIGTMRLRNRMIMPPMETWMATRDGMVTDKVVNYYGRRAEGGVALVTTEMINTTPPGTMAFPGELTLAEDSYMPGGMSRLARTIHAGGARASLQLCHAGVFAHNITSDLPAFTPSGIGTFQLPGAKLKVMTKAEIAQVVEDYGLAAARAKTCGFDAVEIHGGAHGYLVNEFLSGYYNKRTDEYGGSLENRARFALEIIASIQKHCGRKFPIIFRLPGEEYLATGITLEVAKQYSQLFEKAGVAAVHVTIGTLESKYDDYMDVMRDKKKPEGNFLSKGVSSSVWIPPCYSPRGSALPMAAAIKKVVKIPVIAVNSISPEMGEKTLAAGNADFVALGRQSIADPDYPKKVMEGRGEDIRRCLRCNECQGSGGMEWQSIQCSVNPEVSMEYSNFADVKPAETKRRIAVIGSGPAGMEAALTASKRGHEVVLFEKSNRLGGLLHFVGKPDFKADYRAYTQYMIHMVEKSRIDVRLNTEFNMEMLQDQHFDKYIVATGSEHFVPNIPGAHESHILNPMDVLDDEYPQDAHSFVVAGAGLVGCEVSMYLAEKGYQVTMTDILPEAAWL
nr:FAD-dependent oxidoreductase [Liquorilactobacillus satsumensis]